MYSLSLIGLAIANSNFWVSKEKYNYTKGQGNTNTQQYSLDFKLHVIFFTILEIMGHKSVVIVHIYQLQFHQQ